MEEDSENFTNKPTGKRPLGRPRHRWEDSQQEHYTHWFSWLESPLKFVAMQIT